MKLYTEEQVREALKAGFRLAMETDGGFDDWRELFINALTPIELPSDEEVKKEMEYDEFDPYDVAYFGGISYMRNKLQGGNNEQQ